MISYITLVTWQIVCHHGYNTSKDDKGSNDKIIRKWCNVVHASNTEVSTIRSSAVDEWRTSANHLKEQMKLKHQQRWAADQALRMTTVRKSQQNQLWVQLVRGICNTSSGMTLTTRLSFRKPTLACAEWKWQNCPSDSVKEHQLAMWFWCSSKDDKFGLVW